MTFAISIVSALAIGALSVPAALGSDTPPRLNEVAHVYSLGAGEVHCVTQSEWNLDPYRTLFRWGYTDERRDSTVLPPMICAGAAAVGTTFTPVWQQAAGVWMLVHEAFHLRHWRFRHNEAKVECQTIVYFTDAATRLGATDEQAQGLYPYALALYELDLQFHPWHRDPHCVVPPWIPPL